MTSVLLVTLLSFGAAEEGAASGPSVQGKWLIVYAEEGGKRNNAWEQKVATIQGNTLSYESDGKKRSAKLAFGAHQTVKATYNTPDGEKTSGGVYVAGQDYLVLSLGKPAGKSSSSFMLILRRQRRE